jgi:hypothetical protein
MFAIEEEKGKNSRVQAREALVPLCCSYKLVEEERNKAVVKLYDLCD